MRERWMSEIEQPPSENVTSYCRSCNTFTWWKKAKAFTNRHDLSKSFRREEREFWTEYHDVIKCTKCGRSVTV